MLRMLERFVSGLAKNKDPARFDRDDCRLAAAALLIQVASVDGHMSEDERARVSELIIRHFDLDPALRRDLMQDATQAELEAVDLYGFTSRLNRELEESGRQRIVEMMWEIAYVDGRISEFEDNLIWRAADLLHVPSEVRIALRNRVAQSRERGVGNG